jgi:glutamate racemase
LVEEGWIDHPITEEVARIYLQEAFRDGFASADVLLLGCTHYPLLKSVLQRVVPNGVTLVDSAESVALAVLNFSQSGTTRVGPGQLEGVLLPEKANIDRVNIRFFVTDSVEKFRRLGTRFLGREIVHIEHVDLKE